ncbi:MAG: DUF6994 family protein [Candidatus Nanoperiomorbus sp.]
MLAGRSGSEIIFPSELRGGTQTINRARGWHRKIGDRFDLTLECIDTFSILLVDEIEREISEYQLCLKYNNSKLFDLKIYDHYVTFFTKYRTADGLLDNYRW